MMSILLAIAHHLAVGDASASLGLPGLAAIAMVARRRRKRRPRRGKEPLDHPRRKALHSYIVRHPGACFRELMRGAGMPAGTASHHLRMLKRAGLIVEHPHRMTKRFFENHGRYAKSWSALVLLREPALKALHDELVDLGPGPQGGILDRMQKAFSWSRSTTQHRLERLVLGGLVQVRWQGRHKIYRVACPAEGGPAADPAPPRPPQQA